MYTLAFMVCSGLVVFSSKFSISVIIPVFFCLTPLLVKWFRVGCMSILIIFEHYFVWSLLWSCVMRNSLHDILPCESLDFFFSCSSPFISCSLFKLQFLYIFLCINKISVLHDLKYRHSRDLVHGFSWNLYKPFVTLVVRVPETVITPLNRN